MTIGVVATTGKAAQGKFALDSAAKLLAGYNDYFGDAYPLPKLDPIAMPGGFSGAMENWGGITYLREPGCCSLPHEAVGERAARHLHASPGPRDGASMVRRSRHDGLVTRSPNH